MRSTGELLYLLTIIGAFSIVVAVPTWVERTWRPVVEAARLRGAPTRGVAGTPQQAWPQGLRRRITGAVETGREWSCVPWA